MRAVVTIVGVGQRRQGTSKAGRAYDFQPLSIIFEDDAFTGYRAETVNVDPRALGKYFPKVNDQVDCVFHYSNNRLYIDAVLEIVAE